jgi:hypothetical protein
MKYKFDRKLSNIIMDYCDTCNDLDRTLILSPILKFHIIKRGFWKRTQIVLSLIRSYFFPNSDLEKIRINLWGSIRGIVREARYDFIDDSCYLMPVHPNCKLTYDLY